MTQPVPPEYKSIIESACNQLVVSAEKLMWVTEMIGDDKFILDTETGFHIEISKRGEQLAECQAGQ